MLLQSLLHFDSNLAYCPRREEQFLLFHSFLHHFLHHPRFATLYEAELFFQCFQLLNDVLPWSVENHSVLLLSIHIRKQNHRNEMLFGCTLLHPCLVMTLHTPTISWTIDPLFAVVEVLLLISRQRALQKNGLLFLFLPYQLIILG